MLAPDNPARTRTPGIATPGAQNTPGHRERHPSSWQTITVLAAVALATLFRRPDALLKPQFWAEDGRVFFKQAHDLGFGSLFIPYPGYLATVQRLVAWLGSFLSAEWMPALYNWSALVILLGVAWICLHSRVEARVRPYLALALILVPHSGEVFLTLTNTQWILAPVLWLLIIQEKPRDFASALGDFALLLICGLSGPFIIFCAPFFFVRPWREGVSNYNLALVVGACLLAALQAILIFRGPGLHVPMAPEADKWLRAVGFNLAASLFLGSAVQDYLGPPFWLLTPVLLAGMGWLLTRCDVRRRVPVLILLGCAAAVYAAAIYYARNQPEILNGFGLGARYFYLPYVAITWCLIWLAFDSSGTVRRVSRWALYLILLSSASGFSTKALEDFHWQQYARQIDAGLKVKAPINPPGWFVIFDSRLPQGADLSFFESGAGTSNGQKPVETKGMIFVGEYTSPSDFYGTYIGGDTFTGTLRSAPFKITSGMLYVPVTGYPAADGNQLSLLVLGADGKVAQRLTYQGPNPAEGTGVWEIDSRAFTGSQACLEMIDASTKSGGWLGVGRPVFGGR